MSSSGSSSLDGSFPPSPEEDRAPRRLSWGRLLQSLMELKGNNRRTTAEDHQSSLSETGSMADMSLSDSDSSLLCPLEETLAAEVAETITQSLCDASDILGCSKLLLPDCLQHNISQELLHLAYSEPCGLRGALIDIYVDRGDQGSPCTVDQIAVDDTLVPTFHVTLVLRLEATGVWPKVQKLFKVSTSTPTRAKSARHQNTLRLRTSFRAIKRKLYCSGELVIEECC